MATASSARGGGELMSSIAAVRQLVLQQGYSSNPNHSERDSSLADELSAVQQSRYEERLKFEEERKGHQEIVDDLKRRVEQAKREAQQEKAIRLSLEETNEALEQHKKELSAQLDALSSSSSAARTPRESQEPSAASRDRVKELEQERDQLVTQLSASRSELEEMRTASGNWKIQCLASQRQVKELQIHLDSYKKQYEASQNRQKQLLEGQDTKFESFQNRLNESVAARKKAENELKAITTSTGGTRTGTTQTDLVQPADVDELNRKYQDAVAAKTQAENKVCGLWGVDFVECLSRSNTEV